VATVRVKGFSVVRDAMAASVVELEVGPPATIRATLDALLARYGPRLRQVLVDPATGELTPFLLVHNGESVSSTLDRDRPVRSGDELTIIFPIGGGQP
jgi:molybdopterin converting factor small subunit